MSLQDMPSAYEYVTGDLLITSSLRPYESNSDKD